jgi:hypothetical protein
VFLCGETGKDFSMRDIYGNKIGGLMGEMLRSGGLDGNESPREPRETHGPRFEGRPLPISVQIDAVARRDARMGVASVVACVVAGIVEAVVDAVPLAGRAKAMAWLATVLVNGPVRATEIEERALAEGITKTALRRGRTSAGIKTYMAGGLSWWRLP